MHLAPLIRDLAIILGTAGVVSLIFRRIHQPVVLGYLVAGMIVGPHTPPVPLVVDLPNIQVWAELGVIFLMFSLGLEFTFHKLVRVGGTAAGTALVEVLGMLGLGYLAGRALGWKPIDCIFLGGMLAISSTTIIIKAFDALNLKTRRFAEIVFGVLIVEDLVAILLLVALSTLAATHTLFSPELFYSGIKLVVVVGSWILIGYFFIPTFLKYAGKFVDDETLTVLATGLCLLLVWVASSFHYSSALGAFIMGSILAETSEAHRIEKLIRPLRDLFAAVFFVSVGMLIDPHVLWEHKGAILFITGLHMTGKILTASLGALIMGQGLKRSLQIGFSLAQIGEFSFIIASLGATLKVTSSFLYPVAVAVSVITTFTTPYLIRLSGPLATFLEHRLPPHWRDLLLRYGNWLQRPREDDALSRTLMRHAFRFLLNGIVVTVVFFAIERFASPWLESRFADGAVPNLFAWGVGVLVSAPFVWGMFFAFRPPSLPGTGYSPLMAPYGFYFFLGQIGTVVWLGVLSQRFFSTPVSFLLTAVGSALVFFFFYRRLEISYRWFEKRLLTNLSGSPEEPRGEAYLSALAPWDLHLVKIVIHPESAMAGQTLREANVRGVFGLNIVVIRRGRRILASPGPGDRLLSGDELLVLATDEQADRFRAALEAEADTSRDLREITDFSLRRFVVTEDSPFAGKTIRGSGIRENLKGLVVGLERGTFRTINPDPGFTLQAGDLLWIVGFA